MEEGKSGRLGLAELVSIGIGGMIGGGIFAVLGLSLELSRGAAPIAFLVAGIVALLSSYSYAKLSRRFPSSGGTVEFLVQAYGDSVLSGGLNIVLLAAYTVMIALYAYAFGSYGASMTGGSRLVYGVLVVTVIAVFTVVNMLGAKTSGRVELALVAFKLFVLLTVSLGGLAFVEWRRLSPEAWPGPGRVLVGGMIIFLAYEGFELIANAAAEARSIRELEKSYYASVTSVIAVYVLVAIVAAGLLTLEQIEKYRDYALAAVAQQFLGSPGFYLVVAAALASTASAINATLYGNARISYMIAKHGQAPRFLERRVWRAGYEGLVIVSLISIALALGTGLSEISTAGSGSFLLIFAAVNLAAYKLRRKIKASPILTLAATAASIMALVALLVHTARSDPRGLAIFAMLLVASFASEALYRSITGRRLRRFLDERLERRERLIADWARWVPRLVSELRRLLGEIRIYLVGGVARGELESSHDVDLLIAIPPGVPRREAEDAVRKALERAGITPEHPLDIHITIQGPYEEEALRRSRRYKRL